MATQIDSISAEAMQQQIIRANAALSMLDGQQRRTYTIPCGDILAAGEDSSINRIFESTDSLLISIACFRSKRLSIHLTMAFIIYGYLLFLTFSIYYLKKNKKKIITKNKSFHLINLFLICFILITIFSGGMVAGLDAGLVYNTFPLMGDVFIPLDIWELKPKFINFFENPVTVQFEHRILGIITFTLILLIWLYARIKNLPLSVKRKVNILLLVVLIQVSLGIATLMSYVETPIALIHQSGALILYTVSIWIFKSLPFVSK